MLRRPPALDLQLRKLVQPQCSCRGTGATERKRKGPARPSNAPERWLLMGVGLEDDATRKLSVVVALFPVSRFPMNA